jgi:hypothetical protein
MKFPSFYPTVEWPTSISTFRSEKSPAAHFGWPGGKIPVLSGKNGVKSDHSTCPILRAGSEGGRVTSSGLGLRWRSLGHGAAQLWVVEQLQSLVTDNRGSLYID